MKRKTIIIISSLGILLLLGFVLFLSIVGYFFYSFGGANETARKKGETFGYATVQQGCVDESLRQFKEFTENNVFTRTQQLHISKFTSGCLTTCKLTKDFCVNVPKSTDFLARLQWGIDQCKKAGVDFNGPCVEVFKSVIDECAKTKQERLTIRIK